MTTFQPADHLRSRTFLGLLVAQFLAAFNDQAIHASGMFFAINTNTLTESRAISLMPILFYAPWAIFCTAAGWLADRYSKRVSLILWKVVEVAITLLALLGFWLGRHGYPALGSYIVLSTVFLMGMHSAFFVPAKYGAMPEILTPRMLSKGNGVLESLSFLAVILGTVAGGVLSSVFRGQEYMIGLILTGLAVVGAVASFAIEHIPAANPTRPFPPYVYGPLVHSIRQLLTSRPLVFAVIGIAFFTFLVAYMRQVVYMHGQSQLPPWSEAQTSYIVGMVALGIGLGSPLVGYLSGGKVEVGLVPIGAIGMVLATSLAAVALQRVPVLIAAIVAIGFFTGFYLVPLFSLLQHRAPKTSKGDAIATSNFINITGAIAASLVFYAIDQAAERTGFTPPLPSTGPPLVGVLDEPPAIAKGHVTAVKVGGREVRASDKRPYVLIDIEGDVRVGEEVVVRGYGEREVTYLVVQPAEAEPVAMYNKERLPAVLFVSAGAMTLLTLALLWWCLPDLFRRAVWWARGLREYKLEIGGMLRLPSAGPAVVVTDAPPPRWPRVQSAADRVTHFVPAGAEAEARGLLRRGQVVGVSLDGEAGAALAASLAAGRAAPLLPVHYHEVERPGERARAYVVAGALLEAGSPLEAVRAELDRLRAELRDRAGRGEPLEKEAVAH